MRRLILWAATAATLLLLSHIHMGLGVSGLRAAVTASIVLGLVNLLVRPIVRVLTLPITLLTLGLFGWVVNALMLWLVSALVSGFSIQGFWPALWASVILAIVSGVVNWVLRRTR